MLAFIRCLLFAAALAFLPLRGALADGPPSADKAAATEIRTYNVSDLVHEIPNYGSRPEPTESTNEGGLFAPATRPSGRKSVGDRTDDLIRVILNMVQPDSWRDSGGTLGSISIINDCLIISQTPANHLLVQAMLDSLRHESDLDSMIEVNLRWLQLTPEELEVIQGKPAAGTKNARSISLDALKDENAVFCRARTLGFNGQAVTLKSGRMTDVIKNATPVVGSGAALYDIQMEREQSGITVEVMPRRSPDRRSIIVDVQSVVTQGAPSTPPDTNASPRVATTQPSDHGAAEATQALVKILNRGSRVEQSYNTTVRVTDGAPILVGGMTLEPGKQGSRQLYLVISANVIESPEKTGK